MQATGLNRYLWRVNFEYFDWMKLAKPLNRGVHVGGIFTGTDDYYCVLSKGVVGRGLDL